MIIDAFVQLGKSINGYELTAEMLLKSMQQYGIDCSVVCPVQPFTYGLESENDFIAKVAGGSPERFIGYCRVDPRQGVQAARELGRSIEVLGLRGLFLHPWEEGYRVNSEPVLNLIRNAAEYSIPVMIATGYPWVSHALQVANLAKQVPQARIIMTHGGQLNNSGFAVADALLAMEIAENLYIELSGTYRQDFVADVIEKYGVHRVMFGSNAPIMNQGFELERAKTYTRFNADHQAKVLGGNILSLLNQSNQ